MTRKGAAEVLKEAGVFRGLSRGELNEVAAAAPADVIVDGKKVAELGPGSHFVEMSLLEGGVRSATVRTKKVFGEMSRRVRDLEPSPHA
jgi:CRP-like cAMP-binding protein